MGNQPRHCLHCYKLFSFLLYCKESSELFIQIALKWLMIGIYVLQPILYVESKIPVVHLDTSIRMNFLSILQPGDSRHWHSFSLAHKAGCAGTRTSQALWPLNKGRGCFRRDKSMINAMLYTLLM